MTLKKFFSYLTGMTLLTASLHAQFNAERSPLGNRCNHCDVLEFQQHLENDAKENSANEEIAESEQPLSQLDQDGTVQSDWWIFSTKLSHPGASHYLLSIAANGDTVELEDGSVWIVDPNDRSKTVDWLKKSDTLTLTPNGGWSSGYGYRLRNVIVGNSIAVNLSLGPLMNSFYTYTIRAISGRDITLSDGSVWDMSWFDRNVVSKWSVNDVVIVGTNDGWWRTFNPNILIDVQTSNYARGARIK